MRSRFLLVATLLAVATGTREVHAVTNVFEYPQVYQKHQQLVGEVTCSHHFDWRRHQHFSSMK